MADFSSILNKTKDEIVEPKNLPPGEYLAVIAGKPELKESTQKKTPYASFTYNLISAESSVDQELLAAAGGLKKQDGTPRTIGGHDFYLSENSQFIFKQFADGILGADGWESIRDALEALPGRQVLLTIGIEEYQSKQGETREKMVVRSAIAA